MKRERADNGADRISLFRRRHAGQRDHAGRRVADARRFLRVRREAKRLTGPIDEKEEDQE